MKRARVTDQRGFTLVELLVVMLIIGLLAAIAIPAFFEDHDDYLTELRDLRSDLATNAAQICDAETRQNILEGKLDYLRTVDEYVDVRDAAWRDGETFPKSLPPKPISLSRALDLTCPGNARFRNTVGASGSGRFQPLPGEPVAVDG